MTIRIGCWGTKRPVALRHQSRERRRGITAHNSISYSVYRRIITGWFLRTSVNLQQTKQTNSVAFSPQANYTDWATATCRRNLVPTLWIEGCRVVSAADPLLVNLQHIYLLLHCRVDCKFAKENKK
jgi:hypothetical protein